jgi:hypothetical protein
MDRKESFAAWFFWNQEASSQAERRVKQRRSVEQRVRAPKDERRSWWGFGRRAGDVPMDPPSSAFRNFAHEASKKAVAAGRAFGFGRPSSAGTKFWIDAQAPTPQDIVDGLIDQDVEVWANLARWTDLPSVRITGFKRAPYLERWERAPQDWTRYPYISLAYETPDGATAWAPFEWWSGFEIRPR